MQTRGHTESVDVELECPIQPKSMYVIGGHGGNGADAGVQLNTVFMFVTQLNKWVPSVQKMPSSTHDHAAVMLEGSIYVIGGRDNDSGETKQCIRIDQENRWRPQASMAQARLNHIAVQMRGYIYACGGWSSEKLRSCERCVITNRNIAPSFSKWCQNILI